MARQETTILADEKLQNVSDPFDLFHKPETDPWHMDSKTVYARPSLLIPEDDGPILVELNSYDGNYYDTSAMMVQYEVDMLAWLIT